MSTDDDKEGMLFGERMEHPSYAMIGLSRTHGGERPLFGSSILHNEVIRVRITAANVKRDLSTDWFHAKGPTYIEVELSLSQWAEFVSSFSVGDGVPCTVRSIQGVGVPPPPYISKRRQFTDEFRARCQKVGRLFDNLIGFARGLRDKPSVTKAERDELIERVGRLQTEVSSNMPFVAEQFNEQMDKTAREAKGEVEAFFLRKVTDAGLASLAAGGVDGLVPPMIEVESGPEDDR